MSDFEDLLREYVPEVAGQSAVAEAPPRRPQPLTVEQCQAGERRYADDVAAAEAVVRDVFRPLLEDFQKVMESGGVFRPGNVQEGRIPQGPHYCSYQATGSAYQNRGEAGKRRDYFLRISAAAFRSGPLVLSVECRHGATRACRFSPPRTPLVEFAPLSVPSTEIDHESAREWCIGHLEKCAEACREANTVTARAARDK